MCTKRNNVNRRSPSACPLRKLRASGAANSGSASSHSAVETAEYCPRRSQLSQKPPMALAKISSTSGTPVSQMARRMCA